MEKPGVTKIRVLLGL